MSLSMRFALFGCAVSAGEWACNMTASDPQYDEFLADESTHLGAWETLDLDQPPRERWAHIVAPRAAVLQQATAAYKMGAETVPDLKPVFEKIASMSENDLIAGLPEEYAEEMLGIALATNVSVPDIFLVNALYELSGAGSGTGMACTSVVAQDASGNMVHGRNLDFGSGSPLTELMRPLVVHVRFESRSKTVFKSATFVGNVGCLTCVKEGSFSLSVDTRHWGSSGGQDKPVELMNWLEGVDRSPSFISFLTRDAFQQDVGYAAALERMNSSRLLSPAYIIMAGTKAGEGAVITREAQESLHLWSLESEVSSGKPYVLVTNYDHWNLDPTYFHCCNRTYNGNACMDKIVSERRVTFAGLFQVLSSKPNLAPGTIHTSLLSPSNGAMESYSQHYNSVPGTFQV